MEQVKFRLLVIRNRGFFFVRARSLNPAVCSLHAQILFCSSASILFAAGSNMRGGINSATWIIAPIIGYEDFHLFSCQWRSLLLPLIDREFLVF